MHAARLALRGFSFFVSTGANYPQVLCWKYRKDRRGLHSCFAYKGSLAEVKGRKTVKTFERHKTRPMF